MSDHSLQYSGWSGQSLPVLQKPIDEGTKTGAETIARPCLFAVVRSRDAFAYSKF